MEQAESEAMKKSHVITIAVIAALVLVDVGFRYLNSKGNVKGNPQVSTAATPADIPSLHPISAKATTPGAPKIEGKTSSAEADSSPAPEDWGYDESRAINILRSLNTQEVVYNAAQSNSLEYADGETLKTFVCRPSEASDELCRALRAGTGKYAFTIQLSSGKYNGYLAVARPAFGGGRNFCTDETAVIRWAHTGEKCTSASPEVTY